MSTLPLTPAPHVTFYIVTWMLLSLVMTGNALKLYKNTSVVLTINLPSGVNSYTETTAASFNLGNRDKIAFRGYFWYLVISTDINYQTYIFTSSPSSSCLTTSCLYDGGASMPSCAVPVLDPYLGTGCASCIRYQANNSNNQVCPSPPWSCYNLITIQCLCEFSSCIFSNNQNLCFCLYGTATATSCDCGSGNYFAGGFLGACVGCYLECKTCTGDYICTSCISDNSVIDSSQGCKCSTGYWGTAPLNTAGACSACNPECATCIQADVCESCVAMNAVPTTVGCVCMTGYWGTSPLTTSGSCIVCDSACISCDQSSTCTSCLAPNSIPAIDGGCTCPAGYWGTYSNGVLDSCTKCSSECASCIQDLICSSCVAVNAVPNDYSGIGCVCSADYWGNSPLLSPDSCRCKYGYRNITALAMPGACIACTPLDSDCMCDPLCVSCHGPGAYTCYVCRYYSLAGVCVAQCPIGYTAVNQQCTLASLGLPAVRFLFLSVGNTYFDSIGNLTATTTYKKSQRRLDSNTPVTSPLRGIYFPGSSVLSVNLDPQTYIFGTIFTISLWINPSQSDGVVVYKSNATDLLLEIAIISLTTQVQITFEEISYNMSSINPLVLSEWNHILFTLAYSNYSLGSLRVNGVQSDLLLIPESPFLDSLNSSFCFAGSCDFSRLFYTGFVYEIEIYQYLPSPNTLETADCPGCSICPATQQCIPNCKVTEYYANGTVQCNECSSACSAGCVSSSVCSLCADQYCVACVSAELESCTQCTSGYEVQKAICAPCAQGYFYDNTTMQCEECQGLCSTCLSADYCSSCRELSSLVGNGLCQCDLGYSGSNLCTRIEFNASVAVDQDNLISVIFSEPLLNTLDSSEVQTYMNNISMSFNITQVDFSTFTLNISFGSEITNSSMVLIVFVGEIVSKSNALLGTQEITARLFASDTYTKTQVVQSKAKSAASLAKRGAVAGTSVAVGVSLMSMSPGGIFNFLNTAETIYTVYLFNIDFYPVLGSFLVNLIPSSLIPDPFAYIIESDQGVSMTNKYKAYGNNTNLILLNAGENLAAFIAFILGFILILLLNCTRCLKGKLTRVLYYYKFGFFLRYWIQSFLGNLVSCIIGISYSQLENNTQIVDFSLCVFILVFNI